MIMPIMPHPEIIRLAAKIVVLILESLPVVPIPIIPIIPITPIFL